MCLGWTDGWKECGDKPKLAHTGPDVDEVEGLMGARRLNKQNVVVSCILAMDGGLVRLF